MNMDMVIDSSLIEESSRGNKSFLIIRFPDSTVVAHAYIIELMTNRLGAPLLH